MHSNRLKHLLVAMLAVFALGAVAAGAAQAEGPKWITANKVLPKKVKSVNIAGAAGVFKLKSSTGVTIECKKEKDTGEIIGTEPGTDTSTVTFSECSVAPKTVAECSATGVGEAKESGIIKTITKTVLVYREKAPNKEEALDAFVPEAENNVFAEFTIEGPKCALLNKTKVVVKATGPPEANAAPGA